MHGQRSTYGIIKVILSLQNKAVPPHLNFKSLNPRINLETIPASIPLKLTEWTGSDRIASVSSFSLSGTNVHMLVQEPPAPPAQSGTQSADPQMVTISAKSENSLNALVVKYTEFLRKNANISLVDVAYATNICRASLPHRIAIVAKHVPQLLLNLTTRNFVSGKAPSHISKVGFLFSGQGSQYIGMAQNMYATFPAFEKAFDRVALLFQEHLEVGLKEVVWEEPELLQQTAFCQPAIFCIQYSLTQLWFHFGIQPDYVLGHSVGEFAAAVCSRILKMEDAMTLVTRRSSLIDTLPSGSMLSLKTSVDEVKAKISSFQLQNHASSSWVDIAAINSPTEVVVSGDPQTIQAFKEYCDNSSINSQVISASHAFHSRDMEAILSEFGETASRMTYNKEVCVYISGTLAEAMSYTDFGPTYWQNQLRNTVMFSCAVKKLWTECKFLIEIGAQPILLPLTAANIEDSSVGVFCPSLRKQEEDGTCVFNTLGKLFIAGININWKSWFGIRKKSLKLPVYPFNRQKYWFTFEDEDEFVANSKLLHPILGCTFPAPLSERIYYNNLILKELPYMEDHRVADRTIVPAAAYLECILAAGREILHCDSLIVENLCVEAALEIKKTCKIQTILTPVSLDHRIQHKVEIHRLEQPDKWKRHAHSVMSLTTRKSTQSNVIDLGVLKSRLNETCMSLKHPGVQFGPKFQSIQRSWIDSNQLLTQMRLPDDSNKYICHPIILDAMIQTYMYEMSLKSKNHETNMQLPVKIGKLTWYGLPLTDQIYAHAVWDDIEGSVNLYNERGELLGYMEGIEFIDTTVDSFIRSLDSDAMEHMPDFWQQVWRPCTGTTTLRIDTDRLVTEFDSELPHQAQVAKLIESANKLELVAWNQLNQMFVYFIFRTIQECDWNFGLGTLIDVEKLRLTLPLPLQKTKIMESCMELLNSEGYVKLSRVVKSLPSIEECGKEIENLSEVVKSLVGEADPVYQFVKRIGMNYTSIFKGRVTPLELMFPSNGDVEYGAQRFYTEGSWCQLNAKQLTSQLLDIADTLPGNDNGILRILEVGAGTGGSSRELLNGLNAIGVSYEYTFTDISSTLVSEAEKRFGQKMTYRVLNIEQDPLSQGFAPEQYDVIIAMQVIHATADIEVSLSNVRQLLRNGGIICLAEQFQPTNNISFTFGLLDGWWRFQDFRRSSPVASVAEWKHCLKNSGFHDVTSQENMYDGTIGVVFAKATSASREYPSSGRTWMIFKDGSKLCQKLAEKLRIFGRRVMLVEFEDTLTFKQDKENSTINPGQQSHFKRIFGTLANDTLEGIIYLWTTEKIQAKPCLQEFKCGGLLRVCQAVIALSEEQKIKPKVMLVTKGIHYFKDSATGNPDGATAWGLLKSFSNEHPEIPTFLFDTDANDTDLNAEAQEMFTHLWGKSNEFFVALSEGNKYVQRLVPLQRPKSRLSMSTTRRYEVAAPASGSIGDIQIRPAQQLEITENYIEISVQATALNFRDLFVILKPEGFVVPDDQPAEIGLDVSGIVSAVGPRVTHLKPGDEVLGFNMHGSLRSHVVVPEFSVMKIPPGMTFTGAATIPCAFLTAYYSLVICAKMRPSDRVLIHVASGGVGLAAIQIAKNIGAEIYATAGSRRKRAYLNHIGIKHVYHSRNTSFEEGITRDTLRAGVSIVLNSLTGQGFKEASLNVCAQGAVFLEIGKLNIWSEAEVKALRPDMKYYIVDLSEMGIREPKETTDILREMDAHFESGVYTSLPHTTFQLDMIRQAFFYFQEAKHIGKVVIQMPKVNVSLNGQLSFKNQMFDAQSTYLITGGLGGIGLEVARWMSSLGAFSIVLVSRSLPTPCAEELIQELYSNGCNVIVIQGNVGIWEDCAAILRLLKVLGLPPLRGIMHAAGVIWDGILLNQTWKQINSTLEPKVMGAWNLHHLTQHLDLEFFVMFSSMASILGIPGQSNHSAANMYLDSLTHYRISKGLPATSINWGPWSDLGAASHIKTIQEGSLGLSPFSPKQGIWCLEHILQNPSSQTCVLDVNDWNLVKQFVLLGNYMSEIKPKETNEKLMHYDAHTLDQVSPEDIPAKFQSHLESILKQTLRLPDHERIDPDQNFTELGVDSLMIMELRNRLQIMLGGKALSLNALHDNRTIRTLSAYLVHYLNSDGDGELGCSVNTQMLIEDSTLPAHIKPDLKTKPLRPSQFKNVLLTGATGHLGSHLLLNLIKTKTDLVVYCLTRGTSKSEATQRLLNTLSKYSMLDKIYMTRVEVVLGNVTSDRLGLGEEYESLAEKIDAIVHSAAKANHLEGYADGGNNSMRKQNVHALVNVISLACAGKPKRILQASSFVAVNRRSAEGDLFEDYPEAEDYGETMTTHGYSLSKFICEKLLAQASERGLPVTLLRFPVIFGNARTGCMPLEHDHLWNYFLSCFHARTFAAEQMDVPIMPVDVAAEIPVKLFLNDFCETGVYNLTSDPGSTKDIVKYVAGELGINIQFLPFSEWRDVIFGSIEGIPVAPWKYLYNDDMQGRPRIHGLHPILLKPDDPIKFGLSAKLFRNLPEIKNILVPSRVVLLRHLMYYFNHKLE